MKKPKQPDPNPGLIASAQASERIAGEQIALAREQFQWAREQSAADREFIKPFLEQQSRMAQLQEDRANDYWNYEKTVTRPLAQQMIDEAKTFDTEGTRQRLSREAIADVGAQMGQARAATARDAGRYGVNSSAFTHALTKMNTAEGLGKAQAGNSARIQAKALGHAMKGDAFNMAAGISGQGNAATALALQANAGAQGGRLALTGMEGNLRGQAAGMYGMAQQGYGQAGNLYGNEYGMRLRGYETAMQGYGAQMGLIGNIVGAGTRLAIGMKNGGVVDGKGTGISDSIPAMLSDGEYVIPADVVKAKGVEFFDRLREKYHTPAAQQRGVRRN